MSSAGEGSWKCPRGNAGVCSDGFRFYKCPRGFAEVRSAENKKSWKYHSYTKVSSAGELKIVKITQSLLSKISLEALVGGKMTTGNNK